MKPQSHEAVANSVENQELWPRQCHCNVLGLCNMEASLLGEKNKRSPRSDTGFPGSSDGKESACNVRRPRLDLWVRKIPWRREWQHTPVFLCGESCGQRSLVSYSQGLQRVQHD